MAATRLIALHKNKGKSVAACLKSRTDYAKNPDKTNKGELVSSYECSPLTADEEFMLSKRQYEFVTGRIQKNDVIAYQIRQSFKPGEITAEEANKVGYELAMRFTKGKYAFIVATHTDRHHIHNHVIFNSTALDGSKKFRDFFFSALAVQRLSDLICLEHQLSVIEIKPYRERQKRTLYPPKESNRDRLCGIIDSILAEKPKDYEDFLQKLEQQGYEVKRGKYTSVKGARQKRFIRFKTLGAGYSEAEIFSRLTENRTGTAPPLSGHAPILPQRYFPYGRRYRVKGRLPLKAGHTQGIRLLYLKYLYLLRKPPSRRKTPVSRTEVIKFDRYQEQFFYLRKNRIDSVEQLTMQQEALQAEIDALTDRRADLYRLHRKAPDDTACSKEIGTITARLRVLRRELKLCVRIENDIPTVRAQMEISKERSDHEKADKSRPEQSVGADRSAPTH